VGMIDQALQIWILPSILHWVSSGHAKEHSRRRISMKSKTTSLYLGSSSNPLFVPIARTLFGKISLSEYPKIQVPLS